jgi:hypothetical protein
VIIGKICQDGEYKMAYSSISIASNESNNDADIGAGRRMASEPEGRVAIGGEISTYDTTREYLKRK